ncbi:tetratricopeptide repeat protein [Marinobacter sp.]|uniref:tetratricopeptide repeat protein n=1 Tax=Marinobacter sp. TaxID=50741 RepID=UPI00384C6473
MRMLTVFIAIVLSLPVLAESLEDRLAHVQHRWAHIQYELPENAREKAFEDLVAEAERLVEAWPARAEPLIWQGIILSTYAGAKGGLGALGLVKDARSSLEAALDLDPRALQGSAYTSLGSLYYQVPGWPLSFGDDRQARKYLQKALAINPDGIDPNYFFADFLLKQGDNARAEIYFNKALEAPPRESRETADSGRREEILLRLGRLVPAR